MAKLERDQNGINNYGYNSWQYPTFTTIFLFLFFFISQLNFVIFALNSVL